MNPPNLALLLVALCLTFSIVQSQSSNRRIVLKRPGQVFEAQAPAPRRIVIESNLPHAHQRYLPTGDADSASGPRALKNDQRGKSYEFSYAVKDGDHGDDFFHKERRQGKTTVGEYSVLLPDGRTQIVKYTSDAKDGYKADVTYQGEPTIDSDSKASFSPIQSPARNQPSQQPQIITGTPGALLESFPRQRAIFPNPTAGSSHHDVSEAASPIFLSYPLKARRPSISPSILYNTARDFNNFNNVGSPTPKSALYSKHALFIPNPTKPVPKATSYPRPSPTVYSVSALPSSALTAQPSTTTYLRPTPQYKAVLQKVAKPTSPYRETEPQQLSFKRPIYTVAAAGSAKSQVRSAPIASPTYASHIQSPPVQVEYEVQKVAAPSVYHSTDSRNHQQSPSETQYNSFKPTSKSKLIPIEFFKAGPATKSPPAPAKSNHVQTATRTVFSPKSGRFYSVAASPAPQETITVVRHSGNDVQASPALQVVHPGSSGSLSPYQGPTYAPGIQQRNQVPAGNSYFTPSTASPDYRSHLQPRILSQKQDFTQLQHLSLRKTFLAQNQQERQSFTQKYESIPSSVHHYKPNQPDFGGKVAY